MLLQERSLRKKNPTFYHLFQSIIIEFVFPKSEASNFLSPNKTENNQPCSSIQPATIMLENVYHFGTTVVCCIASKISEGIFYNITQELLRKEKKEKKFRQKKQKKNFPKTKQNET